MPIVKCEALDCYYNCKEFGNCAVIAEYQIDINGKGEYIDYLPITDEEYEIITGMARRK